MLGRCFSCIALFVSPPREKRRTNNGLSHKPAHAVRIFLLARTRQHQEKQAGANEGRAVEGSKREIKNKKSDALTIFEYASRAHPGRPPPRAPTNGRPGFPLGLLGAGGRLPKVRRGRVLCLIHHHHSQTHPRATAPIPQTTTPPARTARGRGQRRRTQPRSRITPTKGGRG